jgi:hypothetical protein
LQGKAARRAPQPEPAQDFADRNVRTTHRVDWRSFGNCSAAMKPISIAELQRAGGALAAHEAVTIAQQLIHDRCARVPAPPFGLPSPDTVSIGADGAVVCHGCEVTPTAPEIALFLHAALSNTPRVPGGLRYAIARALHEVDAPPFDTVDDFSLAVARYERGSRRDVLRELAARLYIDRANAAVYRMTVDRRQTLPSATELRRMLREADRQLFERRIAAPPRPTSRPMRARPRIAGAAILCVLTAGAMSFSGSRDERRPARSTPAPLQTAAPEPVAVAVERTPRTAAPPERAKPHVSASAPRAAPPQRATSRARHLRSRGAGSERVLATLRLRWLRRTIVIRDDL